MNRVHSWFCRSDRWRRLAHDQILPRVFAGIDLSTTVLELGPGPGVTTAWFAERARRLDAVDVDPAAVARLRRRLPQVDAQVGDATDLPFEAGSFGVVASCTMLHHLPDTDAQAGLLSEAHRVLAPGGWLCGFDTAAGPLLRFVHLGDTYVPVDPAWLRRRLDEHFSEVTVRAGRRILAFRARAAG